MFTGIVEGIGDVIRVRKGSKKIEITIVLPFELNEGDSLSVDGVCLTAKEVSGNIAKFDAVSETIDKTTLKFIREGKKVNLERGMKVDGFFGGHIVTGHIDGVGRIRKFRKGVEESLLEIEYPNDLAPYIAKKGSIAIDGISLTIADVENETFSINIIPYTIERTSLKFKKAGDYVNIEVDIIARYVKRIMEVNDGRI